MDLTKRSLLKLIADTKELYMRAPEDSPKPRLYDFASRKKDFQLRDARSRVKRIIRQTWDAVSGTQFSSINADIAGCLKDIAAAQVTNEESVPELLDHLFALVDGLDIDDKRIGFRVPKLAPEIMGEVQADVDELQRCFDNDCFRSSVILCGRLLETALHRKYYEKTGRDILETQPGIGLGKLIAKLSDKGIRLDPGLNEQIHLINRVRISTVHKKKEAFSPSKNQTKAMILYTLDVLEKLS